MRRPKRSTWVFDPLKLNDLIIKSGLTLDEIQGGMRIRGHRVEMSTYLSGRTTPSSECLLDLLEILDIDVSHVVDAVFVKRKGAQV